MKYYKIGISVSVGNGQHEREETIIDFKDDATSKEIKEACNEQVWAMLSSCGVESWWEETTQPEKTDA